MVVVLWRQWNVELAWRGPKKGCDTEATAPRGIGSVCFLPRLLRQWKFIIGQYLLSIGSHCDSWWRVLAMMRLRFLRLFVSHGYRDLEAM